MHYMWLSLKKNFNCRGKLTDVQLCRKNSHIQYRKFISTNTNNSETNHIENFQGLNNSRRLNVVRPQQDDINKHYSELKPGEPSRNIIEIIIKAATINPLKQSSSRTIKTVLKIHSSFETLQRFEVYREMIKKKAYQQQKIHPRSTVDGNELFRFYRTTITCFQEHPISQLCQDPRCGVCAMIKSPTLLENKAMTQLSCSSSLSCDRRTGNLKSKNVKPAVIVCRIIAGKVGNDRVDRENKEKYDAFLGQTRNNTEVLIVSNPSAVLPCFVVVFT